VRYVSQAYCQAFNHASVCTIKLAGQNLLCDVQPGQAVSRKAGGSVWPCWCWPLWVGWCWRWRRLYRYRLGYSGGLPFKFPDNADGWHWSPVGSGGVQGGFHGSAFPASAPRRTKGLYFIENHPVFME
jgi:hypothetical protein